jgi:Spy/CpxP family protein refolding chaperone
MSVVAGKKTVKHRDIESARPQLFHVIGVCIREAGAERLAMRGQKFMNKISRWMLAATACLTMAVAVAQDAPAANQENEKKTDAQHQRHMRGKMGRMGGKAHMGQMAKQLNLTDTQQQQLKSLHEQERTKALELRKNDSLTKEQKMEQMKALRESTHSQMNNLLTPDQQKQFAEMKAKHQDRMRKHKGRRGAWNEKNKTDAPKSDSTQK